MGEEREDGDGDEAGERRMMWFEAMTVLMLLRSVRGICMRGSLVVPKVVFRGLFVVCDS